MKKNAVTLLLFSCMTIFFSCSTKVDLYTDYKDIPIIYGLIDTKADTNFVKISKAFCGSNDNPINAYEVALISDSTSYPDKLEAYILEFLSTSGQPYHATGRKLPLDTLTIHNKDQGLFYSPDQKLYYTTENFNINGDSDKYKYKLVVIKPNGDTIASETVPVGGNLAILSATADFQSRPSQATQKLTFRSSTEGMLYDIKMQFNYRETHNGQPQTKKNVSWSYGANTISWYEPVPGTEDLYYMRYSVNTLFNYLANAIGGDTVWDINHPNVTRYIDDFVITMSVGGRELYECYEINNVIETGYTTTNYSNIDGGYGVFSSRTNINKTVKLSSTAKRDLFGMKAWGFKED